MSASLRIFREHGAFAASAICIGDVVPVRARGRLFLETEPKSLNAAHEPAHSEPLPINLPRVARLVARLRLLRLLSRPFSSVVVIGNTLRRLASVLLLRQSQSPHGLAARALNSRGPLDRWSFPLGYLRQKSPSSFHVRFASPFVSVAHGNNHSAGVRQGVAKDRQELVKDGQGND